VILDGPSGAIFGHLSDGGSGNVKLHGPLPASFRLRTEGGVHNGALLLSHTAGGSARISDSRNRAAQPVWSLLLEGAQTPKRSSLGSGTPSGYIDDPGSRNRCSETCVCHFLPIPAAFMGMATAPKSFSDYISLPYMYRIKNDTRQHYL
jgi:hypothetical protein